mmetsp:Transcript_35591/g.83186  ORF Transcript_35591/g.83186 Transcript_35591/m.83186 type:complete len:972 (+) Transcript_35591:110-3025(+)
MSQQAGYEWSQSDSEITIKVPLPEGVGKEKVKVKYEAAHVLISIAGSKVIDDDLHAKIDVDDSYWQLESASGGGKQVVVTLCKKKAVQWKVFLKSDEASLPQMSELDENFDVLALEHDDDDPERVEEQLENEKKLEARYKKLKEEKGLDHEETMKTFFALFDNCIQLYRLNKLSDYLEEVVPACRKRTDKYKLKAIQALAFVRWKQSKFKEALPLFHEMEEILGKGAALCENIAHTYNSLGNYEKAEEYFRDALKFIEQEHGPNRGNRGGVLLGLGLVRDRLGKHREALPVCKQAYDFYKERANGAPASLQAKAGISCAKINAKLGNLSKAEEFIREAVHMYEVTCGETSPLTASAYYELGKCLWAQRKREQAQGALKQAYRLESMKDAWDLVTILEIHNLLMDTHLKEVDNIQRARFADYFPTVEYVIKRVRSELPQDGNAAVYYKAAAELKAWGGKYAEAQDLFEEAVPLLRAEKSTDCTGLINSCTEMMAFCKRNLEGSQQSPMDFELPADRAKKEAADDKDSDPLESSGVIIEELDDDAPAPAKSSKPLQEATSSPATSSTSTPSKSSTAPAQSKTAPSKSATAESFRPSASSTAPPPPKLIHRAAQPGDYVAISRCGKARRPLAPLQDAASFARHLDTAGSGICWVAMRGGDLLGYVLCGSDGVCGNILDVASPDDKDASIRRALLEQCRDACFSRGLDVRAAVSSDGDVTLFEESGWQPLPRVFCCERPQKKSRTQGAEAGTQTQSTLASQQLRRDGKDTGSYYNAWEKLNVEKELVKGDGVDPSIVPERPSLKDDFGGQDLDIAHKITKYAWDQSDKFVSIRMPISGAHKLPEEGFKTVFRSRGVLCFFNDESGKKRWLKVPNLCQEIDEAGSSVKVKEDQVVLKLRKKAPGQDWSDLTDEKDLYQKRREYRIKHGDLKGATTEELLADMYEHATDEERAGLRDAMKVNREKREEDAKKKSGRG